MAPEATEISPRAIRAMGAREDRDSLRSAYLGLLKLCLSDLAGAGTRTISWTGDRRPFSRELNGDGQMAWRAAGGDWPLNALTMVGLRCLDDLQECVESVVTDEVQGDLIEAGAWRGGASILMRASLGAHDRAVWVADSFQGFPAPEAGGDEETGRSRRR
jgi:O-methyltransferase